jgi:hypothetical protein
VKLLLRSDNLVKKRPHSQMLKKPRMLIKPLKIILSRL